MSVTLYATDTDPGNITGCTFIPGVNLYACNAGAVKKVSNTLVFSQTKKGPIPITITDTDGVLSRGIMQGKIWFGVQFSNTLTANNELRLKNLSATVKVGF